MKKLLTATIFFTFAGTCAGYITAQIVKKRVPTWQERYEQCEAEKKELTIYCADCMLNCDKTPKAWGSK